MDESLTYKILVILEKTHNILVVSVVDEIGTFIRHINKRLLKKYYLLKKEEIKIGIFLFH